MSRGSRGGSSPTRAFYRGVSDLLLVGAIGPEAAVDPRGFKRAAAAAAARIERYE